ncbi:TIR-like protein FxsC [Sphaerisporangium aureirubrum]|uniref:TIR-like protein FxsC n=1 Tax=Sphaerisporangium aureirubrum TaxID=1544736 RepID=A0ABW1NNI9_9ACTN
MAENDDDPWAAARLAESALYFFISHAHVKPHRLIDDDPGRHVMNFFRDLCSHIMHMTDCPAGALPGYVDMGMRGGVEWITEIKKALGSCRVFVPLYGPRYFASTACGFEWGAFSHREERHRGEAAGNSAQRAIVPVLWTSVNLDRMPGVAKGIQLTSFELDGPYRRDGIYGLVSTKKWDDYDAATYEIAREIVATAELTRLPPCDPSLFSDIRNPFRHDDLADGSLGQDREVNQ